MPRRHDRSHSLLSGFVVVGLLLSLTVACSAAGSDERAVGSDDASLSSLLALTARDDDDPAYAQYFSLERYRLGAGLPEDLAEDELLQKVFIEGAAELTIANPYLTMLKMGTAEPIVVPLAPLKATYASFDGPGGVLVGDFDPEAIPKALGAFGSPVTKTDTPAGTSYLVADEGNFDTGDSVTDGLYSRNAFLVADDGSQVVYASTGDGTDELAGDTDRTALDEEGITEVAAALDEAAVYAAVLYFDGSGSAGSDASVLAEPWLRAGLGTSIDGGKNRAVMVLWHENEAAAGANAERAAELLGEMAECTNDPDVDQDEQRVVVSCDLEKPGFTVSAIVRGPQTPLFK